MSNFDYYEIQFRLRTIMLGTTSEVSVHYEHVLEKAKKAIAKANKLGTRINKALDKYKSDKISDDQVLQELQGVMRHYCQLMGKPLDVPNNVEELLEKNKELEEEFQEQLKNCEQIKSTAFLKNYNGHPIIGTSPSLPGEKLTVFPR